MYGDICFTVDNCMITYCKQITREGVFGKGGNSWLVSESVGHRIGSKSLFMG